MAMDWAILNWIQNWHTPVGNVVMTNISRAGDGGMIWILLAVVLLVYPKTRKAGLAVALALVLDLLICNGIIKPLVARPRPYDINAGVDLLISRPWGFSFPSGHTAAAFAAATALCFQKNKLRIPALILAFLIGFSRLYLYVHFPTDILGGIVLGVILGASASFLTNKIVAAKGFNM